MRIGAFELKVPLPKLNEPVAFAILRPWIDVSHVGTLILSDLEAQFGAKPLATLAKPGHFFDFTRYRPTLYYEEGIRKVKIPNTTVTYALREGTSDLVFINLLEPHALSEFYVDSILRLLSTLKVKRYCLLGSMYDIVPHTKPLIVNGAAIGAGAELDFKRSGALRSDYQGPTTITAVITQKAPEMGIETMWLIVSLPQYVAVEEDFLGKIRLMEILNLLYNIPVDKRDFEKAAAQYRMINEKMEKSPDLKNLVAQLETIYEVRVRQKEGEAAPKLSPEIEEMLWKIMGKEMGEA